MTNLLTRLRAGVAFFAFISIYFLSPFIGGYIFYVGGLITRAIIIGILIYQYLFAKEWSFYKNGAMYLRGMDYFTDSGLILEEKPLKDKGSMVCYHPHGMMSYGLTFAKYHYNEVFGKFHLLGSRMNFYVPIGGLHMIWIGVRPGNPANFKSFLKKGDNICFVPGGFEEATICQYGEDRVYLKNRKGFIKYALQFGYTVYPTYGFNESSLYHTLNFQKVGLLLNKFKIPGNIFFSRRGIFPHDVPLYTVIGKGIEMPRIDNPTTEDVDKYHQIYTSKLLELYDKYKDRFKANPTLKIY